MSNPTELLERYLQAVRFWLPRAQQQDIIAELSEDLHSQIEEKELDLARPLHEEEVEAILKRCGSPIQVASRYRPQTQLIGPALFPIYQFILKLVLLWILVPVFIGIVGPAMIVPSADRWGALGTTLSTLWTALFMAAAVITLVFALLERTQAKLDLFSKWNPRTLPPVMKQTQSPSRTQSVFELIFGVFGLVWLLAAPHYLFLVLGPAAAFLSPAPVWHRFYWPVIVIAAAGVIYQCAMLLRPQWNWFAPWGRLITTIANQTVLYFILGTALQSSTGSTWQPFLILDAGKDPAHYAKLAAIANAAVFASLAAMWLGFSIAAIKQTWDGMQQLGGRYSKARDLVMWKCLWR